MRDRIFSYFDIGGYYEVSCLGGPVPLAGITNFFGAELGKSFSLLGRTDLT
jgi:hypothetical protein